MRPKSFGTMERPLRLLPNTYRSFAADGPVGNSSCFRTLNTRTPSGRFEIKPHWFNGQLRWPDGQEYPKPQPIRVCYPNVLLQNRAVYFCGVSDITEPYPEWRAFKKELTGQQWDYDFRRLFFTWCPDITTGKFSDWIEVASRDSTCGWIMPGDLGLDLTARRTSYGRNGPWTNGCAPSFSLKPNKAIPSATPRCMKGS